MNTPYVIKINGKSGAVYITSDDIPEGDIKKFIANLKGSELINYDNATNIIEHKKPAGAIIIRKNERDIKKGIVQAIDTDDYGHIIKVSNIDLGLSDFIEKINEKMDYIDAYIELKLGDFKDLVLQKSLDITDLREDLKEANKSHSDLRKVVSENKELLDFVVLQQQDLKRLIHNINIKLNTILTDRQIEAISLLPSLPSFLYNTLSFSEVAGDIEYFLSSDLKNMQVSADPSHFITLWDIKKPGDKVFFPLVKNGQYDFFVDWGDGSYEKVEGYKPLFHSYEKEGVYAVTIIGKFIGISCKDYNVNNLLYVVRWGNMAFGDTHSQFMGASNLRIIATDKPDLSGTNKLYNCFANCVVLNSNNINTWKLSPQIETLGYMFYNCSAFNQPLQDLNMSNVNHVYGMFQNATAFNQPLNTWDTSKFNNTGYMFSGATSFNGDISTWDISKVFYANYMFQNAVSFNQDISKWKPDTLASYEFIFYNTLALEPNKRFILP